MKISIITATYNSRDDILETYNSIREQSFENWEWLVTDDCSSDDTMEILQRIADSDGRVRIFQNNTNSGAAISRNNSLLYASGEFIAFIDSDDLWKPSKLSEQINFMNEQNIDFCFTAYELVGPQGQLLGSKVDFLQTGSFDYIDMLKKKATLGCSTVMLRRLAFDDITMPLLRTGQDYATWLKLLKTGKRAFVYNRTLTKYRIRPNSISRNKFKKAIRQWEIYRDVEHIGFLSSMYYFSFYAWRAVFRK
ncbi:glycosyl transferase family 2 [Vibrio parahaemolyticus]|uniref:Group 2 family glycosyl transferase n=1 Tax=Vibrio parahaemolyticus TaxID=670 RepID=A0A5P5X506_VIBPH|nr:glycosyltransferase family 2 protein [Vibrio parahaemolyticus]EGQ7661882.1 glycosyltransferase [Vibrio parahaemolyticus]EGR3256293.1 glycosyl transferase family 2 [Vibrio parahaemolyticus]KOY23522.1 glycosyl transferase family 2 [Vibrio parahaemolyticus]KYY12439.1 glycosyl transferase family 2 [Vibrio parahaemolyticus]OXD57697.1 glycosyl transferase family 2 [Vibrio parahaemolyticus]